MRLLRGGGCGARVGQRRQVNIERRILRDRIVGSVVLVVAALAFLPMLRDGDGVRPEVSIEPLPHFEQVELAPFPDDSPEWAFEDELDQLANDIKTRDTRIGQVQLVTPEPAAEDMAADDLTHLGAERARELRDQLTSDGVHAFISEARDGDHEVHRVVEGPHITRAEAQGAAGQMRSRYGLEAFVVQLRP